MTYERFPALTYVMKVLLLNTFSHTNAGSKQIISYSITLKFSKTILKEREPIYSVS